MFIYRYLHISQSTVWDVFRRKRPTLGLCVKILTGPGTSSFLKLVRSLSQPNASFSPPAPLPVWSPLLVLALHKAQTPHIISPSCPVETQRWGADVLGKEHVLALPFSTLLAGVKYFPVLCFSGMIPPTSFLLRATGKLARGCWLMKNLCLWERWVRSPRSKKPALK